MSNESRPDVSRTLAVLRETVKAEERSVEATQGQQPGRWRWSEEFLRGEDPPDPIGMDDALQLSAVLICLDVISQDIAKTPIYLMERTSGGGKRKVEPDQHPLARMLRRRPNKHHTWFEWKQMVMLHLGLQQNAFIAKEITPSGETLAMIPIQPWRTRILVTSDYAQFLYEIRKDFPLEKILYRNLKTVLIEDEMIHVRSRMIDGLVGYSNLIAGAKTLTLAQELIDYQTRMFRNDGTLRGVFQQGTGIEPFSPEALENLRNQLAKDLYQLRRHARPLILEDGLQFNPISMTADKAELAKALDATIVNVARQFRVPPHKLFHLVNIKYENMETMESSYTFDTLIPLCEALEERLNVSLLDDREQDRYFFEFDREVMTITDVQKQAEIMKVLLGNGVMTINEARARRGLNPLPDGAGDIRLIPTTYMGVDQANAIVIAAAGVDPAATKELEQMRIDAAAAAAESAPAKDDAEDKTLGNVIPLRG